VLVVVEDGDLHALLERRLDLEALGRLEIFQVDAAERGLQPGNDVHELVRIGFVDLDVEHVEAREFLEQDGLPSITGLEASAPMWPSPNTAVPLVMTPTRLPRLV
jgi:hypothetical protein